MNLVLKTYTLSECMDASSQYALAYEQQGGENLIFCEDRLTLVAERSLLRVMGGTLRTSVTTFARLLKTDERTISKQGSVMAVGEVMAQLQREKKLQCFTSLGGVGNNARCIYETLAQFSASEITPEILRESMKKLPDDMLRKKVSDLALIYEGYTSFLQKNGFLDENRYLTLLPKRIRDEGILDGKNVFFVGYGSFTAQAREVVRAALERANNVVGVFCCGEEDLYANKGAEAFERVCQEFGKTYTRDLGAPLDGVAEILRKGLFNPMRPKAKTKTDAIEIFEGKNKSAETEFVATKIRRFMQENKGARYRDVAVLLPSVDAYSLSIKKTFAEYGIPYFIDEKRSLASHPLARFLIDCFRVVRERFSPDSVQALTGNLFFGESDEYRNYLLKFANYRGGAKKDVKTGDAVSLYDREKLESGRARLLTATENIPTKGRHKGAVYCNAARKILEDFDAYARLDAFAEGITDVAQKGYLAQIRKKLDNVLYEAEALTKDVDTSVAEFEVILKDGLMATELSLIPAKADAVFVGDVTDSRIEKVRVLFVMGMTDEIPRVGTDTAVISDKDIKRLEEVQAALEPTVAEVNKRARECVALNLCTFSDKLYLSYPLAANGDEASLSEIFYYLHSCFLGMDGRKISVKKKMDAEDFCYRCSAIDPAFRQWLIEREEMETGRRDEGKEYASLHEALDKLGAQADREYLEQRAGHCAVARGEELFFKNGKISPTSLEGYFACPFQHFAERGLQLKEREEAAVLAVDTGNFIHEVLQKVSLKAAEIDTADEMRSYATGVATDLLNGSVYAMQQDTGSGLYFSEKLVKEAVEVALAAYEQIKNSAFVVEGTEMRVDGKDVYGRVDRVDGTDKYVRIIDYKTGRIDDSAGAYYTGRKLQMQLYMSELKGERIPAGVFYFPAAIEYVSGGEGRFRMKGFLNGDRDALLCGDVHLTEERKSDYFGASLKNNGLATKIMNEEIFRDFLDYSTLVARRGCAELKEGYIAPTPYDDACKYCKYGGMCGFDCGTRKPRKESKIEPKTIATIAKNEREGEDCE